MKIHNLIQGSPEWLAFRLTKHGASEAAAMLGVMSRSAGVSMTSSAMGMPRSTSGNTSRNAKARARIWRMRLGY